MSDSTDSADQAVQRPVDDGCICSGNWRALVKEESHRIGQQFRDGLGHEWIFFGLVHGDDDYYYGMWREGKLSLLTCVGSIEGHGFKETK